MSTIIHYDGCNIRFVAGTARPYRTHNAAYKTIEAAAAAMNASTARHAENSRNVESAILETLANWKNF
jgi:hypothetical protein